MVQRKVDDNVSLPEARATGKMAQSETNSINLRIKISKYDSESVWKPHSLKIRNQPPPGTASKLTIYLLLAMKKQFQHNKQPV